MPGDCHYLEGNANAKRRVNHARELLKQIGLEAERVQMFNLSSAMAGRFVDITTEMTQTIEGLGPNPLRDKVTSDD
jgi:coenzyme F420-reducing hydrogenase delta subunit